jgi:putative PIN family toxin of toxin-antitoxin system
MLTSITVNLILYKAFSYCDHKICEKCGTKQVFACRDPKDDKFLSLAITGKADCIIAGDKDLLDMIAYEGIPIYRATDFLKMFSE